MTRMEMCLTDALENVSSGSGSNIVEQGDVVPLSLTCFDNLNEDKPTSAW